MKNNFILSGAYEKEIFNDMLFLNNLKIYVIFTVILSNLRRTLFQSNRVFGLKITTGIHRIYESSEYIQLQT